KRTRKIECTIDDVRILSGAPSARTAAEAAATATAGANQPIGAVAATAKGRRRRRRRRRRRLLILPSTQPVTPQVTRNEHNSKRRGKRSDEKTEPRLASRLRRRSGCAIGAPEPPEPQLIEGPAVSKESRRNRRSTENMANIFLLALGVQLSQWMIYAEEGTPYRTTSQADSLDSPQGHIQALSIKIKSSSIITEALGCPMRSAI
uniref:Uncharacterized protein n=1 Tax=Anopheles albimanus TaxID=7167 RepID=A0A182FCN9_ANOAL